MINLATEQLVPLQEVPRLLPPRPSGKRIHVSAVYRWAQRGVGGLRLEAVRVGGTTYTSREALQRFARMPRDDVPPPHPLDPGRERQIQDAARRVQGLLTSPRSAARLRDSTSPVSDRGGQTAAG